MAEKLPDGTNYCRRCMNVLPEGNFYDCTDGGFIDSNKKMSVCKPCIQSLYDEVYEETQSTEKTIHKICISLNVKYSNEAVEATRTHINTLTENGKNVRSVYGIYKTKILATQPSMDKNTLKDMSYEDVGTIFVKEEIEQEEIAIPADVIAFWGNDIPRGDIVFLEQEYANFKNTHSTDTYAEIVLLKQVCYTLLEIKKNRKDTEKDTDKLVKELQSLMAKLAISPKDVKSGGANRGEEAFGTWISDIERSEPAQWLATDPRGDIYRDVSDVETYFKNYIVRPLKNFILQSKDFNVSDEDDFDTETIFDDDEERDELTIMGRN